jgi:hypothetical protein
MKRTGKAFHFPFHPLFELPGIEAMRIAHFDCAAILATAFH